MPRTATLTLLFCLWGVVLAAAQQEAPKTPQQDNAKQAQPQTKSPAADKPQEKLSDAERVMRLQRAIEENEKRLKELNDKLNDPESEYAKAEAELKTLDKELEPKKKDLQKLKDEGKIDQAATLQSEVDALEQRRKLAKERYELAFQERKTLLEQKATLEQKITQDREALNKLLPPTTQPTTPPGQPPTTTTPVQPIAPTGAQPEAAQPAAQPGAQPGAQPPAPPPAGPAPAVGPGGLTPGAGPAETGQAQPGAPTPPAGAAAKPPSEKVQKAEEEAQTKAAEADTAEEDVRLIKDSIETQRSLIESEKKALQTARAKAENADETRRTLADLVQKRSAEGAPQAELQELWTKIAEARKRAREAQAEVNEKVDRIDQLQEDLHTLQAEHIAALEKAEQLRKQADEAQKRADALKNPFSPRNLWQWVLSHGPKLVGIIIAMMVLLWLARVAEHRIVRLVAGRGGPGTLEDRENRAKTLVSVFHHAATWVIIIGGIFMILDEVGVPIAPLMGGAAVIGLAVAFGAQTLVKDYFCGFMILLESQYGINDVIKVGDVGGLVERVTLRVTVLRGLDGTVHFIPNGQIDKVSNMTHGWSRALFEIGVAYKEDVDQVMQVLVQLGKELRSDPTFRQLILDDPEMLGVDSFDDSAVVIKFFIKTRPLQQWTVKRALLRRIKKKFDELGIEIPFPHRTIYYGEPAEKESGSELSTSERTS